MRFFRAWKACAGLLALLVCLAPPAVASPAPTIVEDAAASDGSPPIRGLFDCAGLDADCDGTDDDCDGTADEDYIAAMTSCGVGACAGNTGLLECPPVVIWGANRERLMVELDLSQRVDRAFDLLRFGTQAMELDQATGRIYYYEWQTSGDELAYYDPATGQNTLVRRYSPSPGFYAKRMAQAPDGTMYLSDSNENFLAVDLASGDLAFLGTITGIPGGPYGAVGDIAFAPDGTLYVVSYETLYRVDLNTLQATAIAGNLLDGPGVRLFTGLAFCGGFLYASDAQQVTGRSAIHRLDPVSGEIEELWLTDAYFNDLSSCPADGSAPVLTDSCDPLAGATAETCDGIDNDCDGQTDEGDVCAGACLIDADCDDGVFCNGAETCSSGECRAGTPPSCDDGLTCTADQCDAALDVCVFTPVDANCDDGLFCNGAEMCDETVGCTAGPAPCPGQLCLEAPPTCIDPCLLDADCDDGAYCNGAEICQAGECLPATPPCAGACDEATDSCEVVAEVARLEAGSVIVGSTPVAVPLTLRYTDPVVVTTPQYANNVLPIVTRVSNVTGSSFEVRLQNPSGGDVTAERVHYLVVEAGRWQIDGVQIEAATFRSTITSDALSWLPEARAYQHAYDRPVVVGQVMSVNDPGWSVFWSQGALRTSPPGAAALGVGKTIGEELQGGRGAETIGYVVFEGGHGTLGGVEFEAGQSADTVRGLVASPPYDVTFSVPFTDTPRVGLASMAGVDGANGAWALMYGEFPLSNHALGMAVDEDQVRDPERNHTHEQVHYIVFGAPFALEVPN